MRDLNDEELSQVQGGTADDPTYDFCAAPSCPKCRSIRLNYISQPDGKVKCVCRKCGYTGNKEEFPLIQPTEQDFL